MRKALKSILWVLFLSFFLLGIPRLAGLLASLLDYGALDPDGAYAWISVHHILQALIFIIIMAVWSRWKPLDYGFGWGNRETGRKCVLTFALYFGIYTVGAYTTIILAGAFTPFPYPLTALNILGQMGFQLFLSGPSEELIFRAFAITMLTLVIQSRVLRGKVSVANIIAAVIFGVAHMRFSFAPLEVSYSTSQVILAMVLGLFYGNCYERTGSMYYPMMMHSIGNVFMVGASVIASFIL